MNRMLQAALPLAILMAPLSAVEARMPGQEITVTAPADTKLHAWTTRVGQAIDERLRYPVRLGTAPDAEGIVYVTFRCSEHGTPTDVDVARSSGSRRLDRAGLQAVKGLKSLHPLPDGLRPDQVYRAQMLFAVDDGSGRAAKRLAALRAKGDMRNGAFVERRGGVATASVVALVPAGAQ